MNNLLKEWKKLAKEIIKYDFMYERGESLISDNLYDSLYARLVEIENIIGPQKNSPTNKIISSNMVNKVKHLAPMLSIENGFGFEAFLVFIKRFKQEVFPLFAEHKVDGISIALRYQNGVLQKILTRGNGEYGTDVTRQLQNLKVPKQISHIDEIEIRGELFISNEEFQKIADKFSSPRNACASIVQNKNLSQDFELQFVAHNCIGYKTISSYSELRKFICQLGFANVFGQILYSIEEVEHFFNTTIESRNKLDYQIDGVVLKINDLLLWEELGHSNKYPRYAFAIKFDPISKETHINDIQFQVGKFGTITPVAVFESISIDGHNIAKATLHNVDELKKNQYGVGDRIIVSRAGDTIPYIKAKIYDANNCQIIRNCPSCGRHLEEYQKTLRCMGGWGCVAQRIQRINHFCSRDGFNIDGIGPKVVEELVKYEYIYYPSDLFKLKNKENELIQMDNWNRKSVYNMLNNIANSTTVEFANFLYAICIPNVGFGHSKTLAKNYPNFALLKQAYMTDELPNISGIGQIINESIRNFLSDPKEAWVLILACE